MFFKIPSNPNCPVILPAQASARRVRRGAAPCVPPRAPFLRCPCHAPAFPHPGNSPGATAGPSLPPLPGRVANTPQAGREAGLARSEPAASPPGPGIPRSPRQLRRPARAAALGSGPADTWLRFRRPPAPLRSAPRHIPPLTSPRLGQRWRSCCQAPAAADALAPSRLPLLLRAGRGARSRAGAPGRLRRSGAGGADKASPRRPRSYL